jgi:hypothetical protein
MKRPPFTLVLALQALLVAAAVRPEAKVPSGVDPVVFRANYERWQTLPDTQRDVLRERWTRFAGLPAGEQETMLQRSETLHRVASGLEQRQGRPSTADEDAAELARMVEGARQLLASTGPVIPDKPFEEQLEGRTRRYINRFLDNLSKRGDLSPDAVAKLRAKPLSEQIRDTMLLLQADQFGRYSESLPADESDKLLTLSPWEQLASADRRREQAGFLGRLGDAIKFTESERAQLDTAAPGERQEQARELKAAEIRALLAAHGTPAAHIDELMSGPVNELEREAHDLLGPKPATPPVR